METGDSPMREELLKELEDEYARIRAENEREEISRRERIRTHEPEIEALAAAREELIRGSIRDILAGNGDASGLTERMEKLSGEIRLKLQEKGYPPDYLAPVYRCAVCQDRGRTGEPVREMCACMKRAYRAKLREKIGLGGTQDETFETFDPGVFSAEKLPGRSYSQRDQMNMFRRICEDWADHYPDVSGRNMMLSGKSGLGKTFLLRAMAARLIDRDVDVLIISAYKLIEILRKGFFSNDDSAAELSETDVLMIDDLGSEPMLQNVTVEQLFNLLNERGNRGASTVISTNLDMEEFRNRYTERLASRMRDRRSCQVLALEGDDIRTGGGRRT